MPTFTYKARDGKGTLITETIEAASPDALADRLSHLGYFIISITELKKKEAALFPAILQFLTRIKTDDMVMFAVQLSSMINAGITLPSSLKILIEQVENNKLKKILEEVNEDIKGGATFSDALRKHPDVFSTLFTNMIAAAETAGNLDEVLQRLATFAEKEAELKQKIFTALFYPIFLTIVGVIVVVFVIVSVIPSFVSIYSEANVTLPLPTMILYNINLLIRRYWHLGILGILALYFLLRYYAGTAPGRMRFDRMKLSIPVWGSLIRSVTIARMCRTLSALISSGVPMLQSLETLEKTIDSAPIAKAIRGVYGSVSKGENMSTPLKESKEFPGMTIHMIAVGEETGTLDVMLNKIADFYEMAADYTIRRLTALLEPIFLLVIGGAVLFIYASILLPIFQMVRTLRR